MATSDFQSVVNKVMSDDAFASNLASNPEQALKAAGIQPTGEMLDALKDVDVSSLKSMASTFNANKAAGS